MSSYVHDFAGSATLAASVHPALVTASGGGAAVALAAGDGPCFAVQHVGEVPGDGTLDGRIEESADGTTWAAVAGAAFARVVNSNDVQVIRFTRTARYVRWYGTLGGDNPQFTVGVVLGQQKKCI